MIVAATINVKTYFINVIISATNLKSSIKSPYKTEYLHAKRKLTLTASHSFVQIYSNPNLQACEGY